MVTPATSRKQPIVGAPIVKTRPKRDVERWNVEKGGYAAGRKKQKLEPLEGQSKDIGKARGAAKWDREDQMKK